MVPSPGQQHVEAVAQVISGTPQGSPGRCPSAVVQQVAVQGVRGAHDLSRNLGIGVNYNGGAQSIYRKILADFLHKIQGGGF